MVPIHLCTGRHMFSTLCLACFSHSYITAETINSPKGHMNNKWQEKTKQHCKVQKKETMGGTSLHQSLNCHSVTRALDCIRKNLVNKIGFFPFSVLIFMQSQCNNPDLFFLTLYLSSLLNWASYYKTFHYNTVGL